jgi:uncharacterized protein (DUF2126 family)
MGIQVALNHRTRYRYDKAVSLGPQVIQLRPAPHCRTPILSYELKVVPAKHVLKWQLDPHHNHLARVLFSEKTTEFAVEVDLVAELSPLNPFDFFLEPDFEEYPFRYSTELAKDLAPYRAYEGAGPRLQEFLKSISREKQGTIGFLSALNYRVSGEIGYGTRMEPGVQTCEETLEKRMGSCRDSAWLLVQVLRHLGIAARFVSGYLIQLAPDEKPAEGASGPEKDSAELHAWAEAFLPGAGWIGLDSTSGLFAGEGHIPLVCTPNASKAAPIGGTVEPANVDFSYSMAVRRMNEAPRLSRPFSEEDWAKVEEVAHTVDADLVAQDVRLTMGGEPTFVGLDEPESAQWNIDALGPMKRSRGLALIQRLRERVAPGGMLHYGQGKWYPGEPLPRWALSCYWRADGVAVWEKPELVANVDTDYGFGVADALRFGEALARRLEVGGGNLLAAFNPGDEAEAVGYILPLRRRQPGGRLGWSSQLWFARPERLVLMAGDSPIGFRISTDTMPWVAPDELEYEYEAAPFEDRVKLPAHPGRRPDLFAQEPAGDPLPALSSTAETATELIRPSLCVQAREGRLHVFLPYASKLADYLDVLAAVEDTCAYLKMPVWLEGYTPPSDPRLRSFSLTPDPGVLEVNLPPTSNWDELVAMNTLLFEEARANRLTAEKFNYDGGHVATGGGSHIVIGGATVLDSPLLRRPDLLKSMVAYWQNQPSLSYLFSGQYVGPTSQYPRVDEARMDGLYELEVAFRNLPAENCEPWIVDGLFRNLLVDVTGNSHRAEFCVDKLYAPEGLGLRLGLLELRAFEMTPHLRMGLVTLLLIRAFVAMFWRTPFDGKLVRWGTALHDRFMLPHFVARDFADVLAQLRQAGYAFDEKWFDAQFEFRFPRIGSIAADGVGLELRHALEPWNVLAEETSSGGTVRSVDSSLERIQVKVSGFTTEGRYAVVCNGRRIPLAATGVAGEMVAGVRFRARQLSALLHPTVPVHAPLVFDLVDCWKERSIGRCVYHAVAPDGRVYTARPSNAAEAEERRRERFEVADPAPGEMTAPEEEVNPNFPLTLDLRMPPIGQRISMERPGAAG